ncbi:SUKH-4 family immunity protein [Streptomyces sp. WAC07061]|uniref:SUKH-4 family immunity protein n=1 Tax=Streptomyces sp. WAC07061 TaxID=2487410 RepID=UPI00163B62F4|nr:SUKH-4 family immunity protein [Streptomyces sp. WAC07061]
MAPDDLDQLFASPAALLAAGPGALGELPATGGGAGREAFGQAVAVLDGAEVSRAEFASWLHFGARVLGHEAYAGLVAGAAPDMPWRTVWAWWRPVGAYRAQPNLSGGADLEVQESADGRVLLKLEATWAGERWFDPATGEQVPAPAEGEFTERPYDAGAGAEGEDVCFDDEDEPVLHRPGTWEEPVPLGGGRFAFAEERGIVVVERGGGLPAGASAGAVGWGTDGPWFAGPAAAGLPLDAGRLAEAFGADWVLRLAPERQPAALRHSPTRELVAAAGLPRWWAAGVASFSLAWTGAGAHQMEPGEDGLLPLGTFDLMYGDSGRVSVHPETGAVWMVRNGGEPFLFARDVETFVRLLEAVYRFMGACWSPYPGEDGKRDFVREAAALEPLSVDPATPAGEVWEHLFAAIVELSVWGY